MQEVVSAVRVLDDDPDVRAVIITGRGRAFAAGADIKEMADLTSHTAEEKGLFADWQDLSLVSIPLIAAVNGYALGGGFELALLCDIIIASEAAEFGFPEITLGVLPGIGGTQRLTRIVGRPRAMDMILTSRRLKASEAATAGIVSRVVPADQLMQEAVNVAKKIASFSSPAVARAKAAIEAVDYLDLDSGIDFERQMFYECFDQKDQKEGMAAFVEKREPKFNDPKLKEKPASMEYEDFAE
eukprot:jgi/Chrzof1/14630/Cz09g10030.t1_ECH2